MTIKTLILRAPGTNCHLETALAVERAGGQPEVLPLQVLLDKPERLLDYAFFILPGGFSYGDDISAGRVFANALMYRLQEWVPRLIEKGGLILGICNGFQVLVKSRLLPFPGQEEPCVTLTDNDSARFECRWVRLEIDPNSPCLFTRGLEGCLDLPVAHGEGKFVWKDDKTAKALEDRHLAVFRYSIPSEAESEFPFDPNGSNGHIAGICDPSGQVLGLMPHPERHQFGWQHPAWTRGNRPDSPIGLDLFRGAIETLKRN